MSNSRGNGRFYTTSVDVEVDIDADDTVEHVSDEVLKEEYTHRFKKDIDEKQLIIKLVQENDKRTALYELEKLLGVYSNWVNY